MKEPPSTDLDDSGTDAVAVIAEALAVELALDDLLERVVAVARDATGARYVALGVIGPDQRLGRFVHTGIDDDQVIRIGALPTGHGVLGLLIRHPQTLRLDHLADHPASSGFPRPPSRDGRLPGHADPVRWDRLRQSVPHREGRRLHGGRPAARRSPRGPGRGMFGMLTAMVVDEPTTG